MSGQRFKVNFLAFIAAMAQMVIFAASAPAQEQPNLYEFFSRNHRISYATISLSGEPLLSYRDARQILNFKGDEIRVADSEIGQLVTVTLEQIPDLKTATFTLLIPQINLSGNEVLFNTVAITTTHLTSIGGPALVKGPLQTYRTLMLRGKASHVVFVQPGQSAITGEVTLSPTCPGPQHPGQVCIGPFAGTGVQIIDAAKSPVASTTTDAQGLFQVQVEPGDYTVRIETRGVFPNCPKTPVTVPAEGSASVAIHCDTGIR